jgi:hypothetical protein
MLAPLERHVKPELLDTLPPTDPRAVQSRRDLIRVNTWMGNPRIMTRCLERAFPDVKPRRLVELGAGDGTFLSKVARKLHPAWGPGVQVTLVDQQDVVRAETLREFEAIGWSVTKTQMDVFDWVEGPTSSPADAIVANLFLHHFTEPQLVRLLTSASRRTSVIAAVEPRRSRGSLLAGRLLWAIGCNEVTRHDALVSIRAGFAGDDISRLWPSDPGWELSERPVNFSSHLFVARRQTMRAVADSPETRS